MLKRLLAVVAFCAGLLPLAAAAQSGCSVLVFQQVPTPAQWQQCFQAKADFNGSTPVTNVTAISPVAVNQSGANLSISLGSPVPVSLGGTGVATFTANLPIFGNGTAALIQGTLTGNTTKLATSTGALVANDCVKIDASLNFVDAGSGCGSGSTTAFVDDFIAGTNFTPGVTTSLVLSHTPANAQILSVAFDGVTQAHTTYNLSTATVTFNAAIPTNVQIVEAQYIVASVTAGVASITTAATTQSGALTFVAGTGITITPSGQNLTFAVAGGAVTSVSPTDASLTISPTSGAVLAALNTAHSNNFSVVQTITVANAVGLMLDTPSTGQINAIQWNDHGTGKWQIAKGTSNDWELFDVAASRFAIQAVSNGQLKLMPASGSVTNTVAFYADLSGHPYCDVRALGALGVAPSSNAADQAAIASAYSICAQGLVYFPAGNYGNTATWSVVQGTHTAGASANSAIITTTQTNGDVFLCVPGGAFHTTFNDLQIVGTGASASPTPPTGGYAIDCPAPSANQEHFDHIEVIGTYNGVMIGGTNGQFSNSRLEQLYGTLMIYEPNGGNHIQGNQFDNNQDFLITNNVFTTYNTGTPVSVSTGTLTSSNGRIYVAVNGGVTGPAGSGLPNAVMFTNVGDGTVTWHLVGNAQLTLVWPGTETWVLDNDLTSAANFGVLLDGQATGHTGAVRTWIRGNDFGGEISTGVGFQYDANNNHVLDNQFQLIGYTLSGASTGFPIWDLGGFGCTPACSNDNNTIIGNTFVSGIHDGAILATGNLWTISNNLIAHNQTTTAFCAIELFTSGSNPQGTTVTGNIIPNASPGAVCTTGGGGSNTVVVGNSVFGGTISLTGTNVSSPNL